MQDPDVIIGWYTLSPRTALKDIPLKPNSSNKQVLHVMLIHISSPLIIDTIKTVGTYTKIHLPDYKFNNATISQEK